MIENQLKKEVFIIIKGLSRLMIVWLVAWFVLTPHVSAGSLETDSRIDDINPSPLEAFQKQNQASFCSDEYVKFLLDLGLNVKVTDTFYSVIDGKKEKREIVTYNAVPVTDNQIQSDEYVRRRRLDYNTYMEISEASWADWASIGMTEVIALSLHSHPAAAFIASVAINVFNLLPEENWVSLRNEIDNDFYYLEDFYEIYVPQMGTYCSFVITQSKQTNVQATCKWMTGPTSYQDGETYNNVRTEHSQNWLWHTVNENLARENYHEALADGAWEMWPYCTVFAYCTGTRANYYYQLPSPDLIPPN